MLQAATITTKTRSRDDSSSFKKNLFIPLPQYHLWFRRYRKQLRRDEIYAQLTNENEDNISGKVAKHYGLRSELFSGESHLIPKVFVSKKQLSLDNLSQDIWPPIRFYCKISVPKIQSQDIQQGPVSVKAVVGFYGVADTIPK